MIKIDMSINAIILSFGLFISLTMAYVTRKHWHDQDKT
jgi:hypothetical protein